MSGNGGEKLGWKCLLVVLMVFGLNVEPSWSSCSAPFPIKNGTLQIITKPNPGSGKYPENAEAKVECDPGFRLTYAEYEYVICTNGAWKHHVKPEESICGKKITYAPLNPNLISHYRGNVLHCLICQGYIGFKKVSKILGKNKYALLRRRGRKHFFFEILKTFLSLVREKRTSQSGKRIETL